MRLSGTAVELSASDLSQSLSCRHLTALNLAVALGRRAAPTWTDPMLVVLQERGLEHERNYVEALRSAGLTFADVSSNEAGDAVARSLASMRSGVDVIVQPALRTGRWFGRPDILRRVEHQSALGNWSYEVMDTKLAKETRGGTILQLALYSDLLRQAQGAVPLRFQVGTPNATAPVQTFRVGDFAAYFRLVRRGLEVISLEDPDAVAAANYPEPVEYCGVCRWWAVCDKRRREDDHLSLVAGISRLQTRELEVANVGTLAQLGELPLPLPFVPRRGAVETYVRVREQARVQLEGRTQHAPVHELLPIEPGHGLTRLPAPSPGDIFLDLEGDPFARDGGREYLFGTLTFGADGSPNYQSHWAVSDADERNAFETVIGEILKSLASNPAMHVYHYAPYEPAAFKRLMGRYASRETEIDRMLRAELFVDLYAIVRHSLRASVERYSIKDLEPFYGFSREVALSDARTNLRVVERALELGSGALIPAAVRTAVEGYNRDDCASAHRLRDWLEQLRETVEAGGMSIPRPEAQEGSAPDELDERAARVLALWTALTAGVPSERSDRDEVQQGRWLLAHLLDWHRREAKAPWWEYFRLRDLSDEELLAEKAALAGLELEARVGGTLRSPIDRYRYPRQDTEVGDGDEVHLPDGGTFGIVEAIDYAARTIDVKKRQAQAEVHPTAVFAHSVVNSHVMADALLRLGEAVAQDGLPTESSHRCARQLLLGRAPRLRTGGFVARPSETAFQFAVRVADELDHTVLPIQGPPGAGKTYTGAQMICELVRQGARVGITAMSHKVIRKLIDEVVDAAGKTGQSITCIHKVTTASENPSSVEEITDNAEALARIGDGRANVLGGTSWLWARPEAEASVDVLFVDEAGQMSLANVLAASQAAASVVLLGDPQQLEQPQQGTHPEGADVSALEHILQGHETISDDRGIFLPETWRLAPGICAFTSEVFYEGKLHSLPSLDKQVLVGTAPFEGSGLWVAPVMHEGNQNSSSEEAGAIDEIVKTLLAPTAHWVDRHGVISKLTAADILIVAPYNSQVSLLSERLAPLGIRLGTVDRFQGQEAPVVIYSMATSSPEDAPRGMEFLYSLNRLNVATSRARCAAILVASPRLFAPECKSPRQMRLANAICRYIELARFVTLP